MFLKNIKFEISLFTNKNYQYINFIGVIIVSIV